MDGRAGGARSLRQVSTRGWLPDGSGSGGPFWPGGTTDGLRLSGKTDRQGATLWLASGFQPYLMLAVDTKTLHM